ncbi:7413_t:CDS:2 [Cetraspora pellucida]|uniref:7413_t:CDS:1 n=1 Tax=Cetraspora pellucida TaxID=1433469 RepID=A0A9N8WCH3_9GLOM|nr:7413_t:CDS:2 [Cetraspora pellucida]
MSGMINGALNKTYKTFAKIPITQNLSHFGKGIKYLNEAHDQKNRNLECSALLYKEAVNNLKIANKHHPASGEIKKTLAQACREYDEILTELSLSKKDNSQNNEYDDAQRFIENKFFQKNHYVPEKHIPLGEDDVPINTQQLAYEIHRKDISDEQKMKLCILVQKTIDKFAKMDIPTLALIHEVMVLSNLPDAEEELYRHLVNNFLNKINQFGFLFPSLLEGLSHIIRQANPKHLKPNDLVCILNVLNVKFKNLHTQDKDQLIEMTRTLGWLFDVMADCEVRDLQYENLYKPLYDTFKNLNSDNNQELAYLAGYACQALNCIPSDESPWKAFQRRGGKVLLGITKLAGAIKNIDPGKLPDVFKDLSEGFEGIINVAVDLVNLVKEIQSVKEGVGDIKQSFSWETQRKWYWALRFTDLFIQSFKFASLEQFIYKIPCRQDDKFLWGLCERLKRLAADSKLDNDIRKGAIEFLNNVCQNKEFWGVHPKLNEWILEHVELKTLPKYVQTSVSFFQNTLLNDVLCEQTLNDFLRPTQQNDLRKSRGELLIQLNGLKDQFFSDLDNEFEEALGLYVKPQGTWKVSIIKSSNFEKKMVSENREGDVEVVVNRFLESKDKLTSKNKEALEIAANKLSNSKDIISIIKTVNSFLTSENLLTFEDEKILEKVVNQFLDLKVNKALELQEIIANEFLHFSKNKELLMKAINNVLKKNPIIIEDDDVKLLEIEANKFSNLNDKSIFKSTVNKFLAFKANKILEIAVNEIVASKCKRVLLILGMGGVGKSTFGRYLARRLWEEYDQLSPIPLFIPLARLKLGMFNRDEDFIELYLKERCKLSTNHINALRERKFVFILDGYDEIVERERNCYIKNKFCQWKNAKVIISCRPEYLGSGYQRRFFPNKNGEKGFQELTIKPFSEKEIEQYVMKYVQKKGHLSEDTYLQQIKKIPEELASNPILLKITLSVLPRFIEQNRTAQINRIALYDEFLKTWFDRAQDRLYKIHKTDEEEKEFSKLNRYNFPKSCLQFSKKFAVEMFKDNNNVVITYNSDDSYDSKWATYLDDDNIKNSLLRFSMPLIRRENQYWFIHKTLRDHLIAQAFLESCESLLNATQSSLHAALFKEQSFVFEHGVRQFLVEHIVQKMETFKPQLLAFIEASKKNDDVQVASANAITILAQADILLVNLNDTNISGADLCNKIFNNLKAERAKLNNVNFQNAELKDANLRCSSLQGANFKNVTLQNANLRDSSLQNAHFEDANLSFADLQNTIIQDANFKNARLRNANFQNAHIKDVDFTFADLQNTVLVGIDFQELSIKNSAKRLNKIMEIFTYSKNSYDSVNLDDSINLDYNHYNVSEIRKQFLDADRLVADIPDADKLPKEYKTIEMSSISTSELINLQKCEEENHTILNEIVSKQGESANIVDWNRLRMTDLKAMCLKCNIQVEDTKTDLINRLEAFWKEPEINYEPQRVRKGKLVEQNVDEDYDNRERFPVLDKSLQQWSAQQNKSNGARATEESFPRKKFKRPRDQHEYDAVCDTGRLLHQAIQEDSKEKAREAQEYLKLRVFILRVAEEEGWNVAAKIPKPTPSEDDEFKDLLIEARKKDSRRNYITRSKELWVYTSMGQEQPGTIDEDQVLRINCRYKKGTSDCAGTEASRNKSMTGGTLKKPRVEVCSSPHSSIRELSQKARILAKNSLSPFYRARSDKYCDLYNDFCKKFEVDPDNPMEDGILAFIMWLDVAGYMSQAAHVLQAVTLLKQYLEIPSKTNTSAPIFLSKQGKKVSISAIGSIVK